jgi:ABC-type sugar transport system substrate-binding protein
MAWTPGGSAQKKGRVMSHKQRAPLFGIGIAALLIGGLIAGCSSTSHSASAGSQPGNSSASLKVGFSLPALDAYYSVVQQAAQKQAKALGVDLIVGDGVTGASPTVQIAKVQDILVQHPKILLISPQGTGLLPVLNRAVHQGVKVIFIDQEIPTFKPALSFIGTNNQVGSALIGNYLVKVLHGKGEVGMLLGVPGTPVSNARYQSAANILKKAGIKVVLSSQTDACVEPTAINIFRTMLLANPNMNAAYTICGPDGMAVAKVLGEQPRNGFICSSFDLEDQQARDIASGNCSAGIAQLPVKLGQSSVSWAKKVAAGATIPKVIDNGTTLVTKANINCWYHGSGDGYSYPIPSCSS